MKSITWAALAMICLVGCQAASKSGTHAVAAAAPQAIQALYDQATIYVCPTCKMEYDRAGQCPMCKVALVETKVDYICPADDQPVQHAGKCPRCETNARVVKTAMAQKAPGAATRN
jgi:hypothetical protein